jgi:BirA family biotin operon repressor/biotin-[acetyl-CoA-carboxylase] ligase
MDTYNISRLEKELGALGYALFYFSETESTMNVIQDHAKNGEKNMILALADHQTMGVGREGRAWRDRANCSLMFSLLFQIPQESVAVFADLVALGVCEALRDETGLQMIKIKYPNDVVINDKKLGGVLVKNMYDDKLKYLGTNIGIGINVHYNEEDLKKFPTDYPAASADAATGLKINREKLLIAIAQKLRYLETEVGVVNQNNAVRETFESRWREASGVLGREIAVLKNDRMIESGKVVDTKIGRGVEIENNTGRKWVSLFNTEMKARILN